MLPHRVVSHTDHHPHHILQEVCRGHPCYRMNRNPHHRLHPHYSRPHHQDSRQECRPDNQDSHHKSLHHYNIIHHRNWHQQGCTHRNPYLHHRIIGTCYSVVTDQPVYPADRYQSHQYHRSQLHCNIIRHHNLHQIHNLQEPGGW